MDYCIERFDAGLVVLTVLPSEVMSSGIDRLN